MATGFGAAAEGVAFVVVVVAGLVVVSGLYSTVLLLELLDGAALTTVDVEPLFVCCLEYPDGAVRPHRSGKYLGVISANGNDIHHGHAGLDAKEFDYLVQFSGCIAITIRGRTPFRCKPSSKTVKKAMLEGTQG